MTLQFLPHNDFSWSQLENRNILFKTEFGDNACNTPRIENCSEGIWWVLVSDGSGEHKQDPRLSFECGK